MEFPRLPNCLYNDIVFLNTPPANIARGPRDFFCMDIVTMSLQEVIDIPDGLVNVHFMQEPFIVPVSSRRLIFTWFYWQLFKQFPGSYPRPQSLYTKEMEKWFNTGTNKMMSSNIFWNVYYGLDDPNLEKVWEVSEALYTANNLFYNWCGDYLSEYETGIDYDDTYDLLTHPGIVEAIKICKETINTDPGAITACYAKAYKIILSGDGLDGNAFRRGARTGIHNMRALMQIGVMRGSMKELDGTILPNPILTNFGDGHNTNYFAYTDSISAKRAEMSTKNPLRKSEYETRKYQMATSRVGSKSMVDCETDECIETVIHPLNFDSYIGLYQKLDDGSLQMIQETDIHLKGKLVRTRSLACCGNPDPQHPCKTCIGHNAQILDIHENLGHALTVGPCAAFSNALMAVKHLENSAVPTSLVIPSPADTCFSKSNRNEWLIVLNKGKTEKAVIKFKVTEAKNLCYLQTDFPIKELDIATVTSLKSVVLEIGEGKHARVITLKTTTGTITSSFTTMFLEYIHKHGYTSDGRVFSVDVTDWHSGAPMIQTPRQNVDLNEHLNQIGSFLMKSTKSSPKEGTLRIAECTTVSSAVSTLLELFRPTQGQMMTQRMKVHLNQVEIFVLAAKIKSAKDYDYNLPAPGEPYEFSNLIAVINNGSYAVKQAFERGREPLVSPISYVKPIPQPHPMDTLIGAVDKKY